MTISRERATISTVAPGQAQFTTPLAGGETHGGWILVGTVARRGAAAPPDRLYLIAEPVGAVPRIPAIGPGVLAAIRDIYGSSKHQDPATALTMALDTANLALYRQNLTTTPGRRVILGVSCLIVRDDEVLICQVPPTQLLLSQGGTPIALPELASWQRDYQPHARDDRQGLGATETVAPLLFRATLESGDLLTLCTSNLARLLAESASPEALGPLLGTDPDAAIALLAELADRHGLTAAYATTVAPFVTDDARNADEADDARGDTTDPATRAAWEDRPEEGDDAGETGAGGWFARGLRGLRERASSLPWPRRARPRQVPPEAPSNAAQDREDGVALREALEDDHDDGRPISAFSLRPNHARDTVAPAETDDDDGWDDEPSPAYREQERHHGEVRDEPQRAIEREERAEDDGDTDDDDADPYARRQEAAPRRPRRTSPRQVLGSLLTLPLLVLGTIAERISPPGGRRRGVGYLDRSRNRIWPLAGLVRYRSGGLPLGGKMPLLVLGGIVILVALLLLSLRNYQITAERARFDTALATITDTRVAAQSSPDRQAAHLQLLALPTQLSAIPAADKPGRPERIAAEGAALAAALDQVDGVQRLPTTAIQLLAPLPTGAANAVARPQIVVGDGKQFVLHNGTVYGVDGRGALAKILAKGDTLSGVGVSAILGIAWRVDSLFAYTETQGFVRDGAGNWSPLPLSAGGRKVTAVDSFGGNLYFLEAERGQIVKYAAGAYNQAPQPWSSSKTNVGLTAAIDMTIDTDIYALLADGRVLDLYQGEIKATHAPTVVPPLAGAAAITTATNGKWLYIADQREGRIIRLGRDGTQLGVFKPADGAKSFSGAREIAIDEATNTAYLLTDEGLLSVRLP